MRIRGMLRASPPRRKAHHVHGGATARNVDTADERVIVQAVGHSLLGFQDALAVDELKLVGGRRQAADADESLSTRRDIPTSCVLGSLGGPMAA
jgi:hypothetical protein